jgi:hypothetical protein
MGKLVINVQVSLDGVMQGPGGPDEDTAAGFQQGGWAMPYFDESMVSASSAGMTIRSSAPLSFQLPPRASRFI